MKISKELIEQYHRGQCSQEERDAIEFWLFSGDSDEALQLPLTEDKAAHKAEIWKEIESIIPHAPVTPTLKKTGIHRYSFWTGAIAASLLLAILSVTAYFFTKSKQDEPLIAINNSSLDVRQVEANAYNISIGPNTSAKIDNNSGIVNLTGSLLISPKKDITLQFEGSQENIVFKAGQTYIVLKGEDGNDKVIIINEKNIMDLPPVLQKQIINEFKI
ncbi:hypothetical protein ABDJ41_18385 [Pedobacter sp. ASV1-7]|uniref:hypothetical protein n=1 Tax=Pedobacter sp. ASV1-7 TaxID=3145237 RepID=UPI0032E85E45